MRHWEAKLVGCGEYVLYEQNESTYETNSGREEIRWDRKDQVPDPTTRRIRRGTFKVDQADPTTLFMAYAIMFRCFQSKAAAERWAKAAAWKFLYMRIGNEGFSVSERHIRRWMVDEYESRKGFGLQEYAIY